MQPRRWRGDLTAFHEQNFYLQVEREDDCKILYEAIDVLLVEMVAHLKREGCEDQWLFRRGRDIFDACYQLAIRLSRRKASNEAADEILDRTSGPDTKLCWNFCRLPVETSDR